MLPHATYDVPSQLPPSASSQQFLWRATPTVLAPTTRLAVVQTSSGTTVPADAEAVGTANGHTGHHSGPCGLESVHAPSASTVPTLVSASGTFVDSVPLSALAAAAPPHAQSMAPFMANYGLASPPPAASTWGDVELGCVNLSDSPNVGSPMSSSTRHRLSARAVSKNSAALAVNTFPQGMVGGISAQVMNMSTSAAAVTAELGRQGCAGPVAPLPVSPATCVAAPHTSPSWWNTCTAAAANESVSAPGTTPAPTTSGVTPHVAPLPHAYLPSGSGGGSSTPSTPATSLSASQRVVFLPLEVRPSGGAGGGASTSVVPHDRTTPATPRTHLQTDPSAVGSGGPQPHLYFPLAPIESASSSAVPHLTTAPSAAAPASAAVVNRMATPGTHLTYVSSLLGSPSPESNDVFVPIGASFPIAGLAVSPASSVASRARTTTTPIAAPVSSTHTHVPCIAVPHDEVVWCSICHCANASAIESEDDADHEVSGHERTSDPLTRSASSSTVSTTHAASRGSSVVTSMSEGVREGSPMVRLACQHTFHTNCIQRWLLRETTCPICRREVVATPKPIPPSPAAAMVLTQVPSHGLQR